MSNSYVNNDENLDYPESKDSLISDTTVLGKWRGGVGQEAVAVGRDGITLSLSLTLSKWAGGSGQWQSPIACQVRWNTDETWKIENRQSTMENVLITGATGSWQ